MTIEYIKQKLIGLGLVLDDKEVTVDKNQVYKHNKLGIFLIFTIMMGSMHLIETYYPEIHQFIESLLTLFL